ncbi:hypothetical protein DYB25_005845 [Aphanomyces astaci]|uniref:Mannosylglycerate hydrolase MGH1-like glycoside hydrolase domain-containing protein n=1 Tax=Aphanomyces astaci TaxID=112090 RepID=A0A397BIW9_APHAT|nr:hypothetical protein DYB25_005845 [Aphanomyces astaci]
MMVKVPLVMLSGLAAFTDAWPRAFDLYSSQDQLDTRTFDPDDVPPHVPQYDEIVKAAYAVLTANFDDQMNATAPGPQEDIGFQHINSRDALLSAQALAHRDFSQATAQFKYDHVFVAPSVVQRFHAGPRLRAVRGCIVEVAAHKQNVLSWASVLGFIHGTGTPESASSPLTPSQSDARTNSSTSGILAPPLHAETAMRIFYLAPLDTSMSTPVYTHEAMGFLCDVFPSLYKFHAYLLASRQRTNTSLLSLRVISRLQVPTVTAQAFVAQAAVFYPDLPHDEIIQDIYYPMLYLASCVGNNSTITSKYSLDRSQSYGLDWTCRCATTFDVVDIEFNTIFLRSAEALAEMATLLYQPVTKLGFSCPVPNKVEVQNLAAVVTTLSATLQSELWDPNSMHGIARYLMHRTFALTIPTAASKYHFVTVFDTSSGQPPLSAHWTSSSSLSAAIVLNMGLPDVTTPPSPDTPPIDRDAILIVMCIELVVAMAVAVSCVVFSVYFVVKRPREELAMSAPRGSERGGAAAAASPEPTSGPSGLPGSPDKRYLEESLLSDDDDHDEYGSFLSSPVLKPAVGMWSSMKGFVSSISPWG